MDLKVAITLLALAITVIGEPVPPNSPKYIPVFVSSEALNQLNEKEGQNTPAGPNESGQDNGPNENQNMMYGPPAPVYEHQSDQYNPSYVPQAQNYQNNNQQQPQMQPEYQQPQMLPQYQQPIQSQPPQIPTYPVNQQPLQSQQPQIQTYPIQQPVQYQQPAQQPLFQMAQQPAQQAIVVAQRTGSQPLYGNQQQIMQQPLGQQIIPQQAILVQQPNQNGEQIITSNPPINLVQPNNQNPVYAVVPINGQNLAANQNVGTSTYLVPVQQAPNQVFGVNSG